MMTSIKEEMDSSSSSSMVHMRQLHKHRQQQQSQSQSLSSLIQANLQIHCEDNDSDNNDHNVNVNLETYLKWRKQHEKQQQQLKQTPSISKPGCGKRIMRLNGLHNTKVVQNAERFVEQRKRTWRNRDALRLVQKSQRHLEEKKLKQQQQQHQQQKRSNTNHDHIDNDDDDDNDTASVTTYASTVASNISSSCASTRSSITQWGNDTKKTNNSTMMMNAHQVFARPPPPPAVTAAVVSLKDDNDHYQSQSRGCTSSNLKEYNDAMDFLTAAMSAKDKTSHEAVLADYTTWNCQQKHQQQHSTRRPKRRLQQQKRRPLPLRHEAGESSILPAVVEDATTTTELAPTNNSNINIETSSSSFMGFLTAAMSASFETIWQEAITNFGEWNNRQQQQQQQQQYEESCLFSADEETGTQHQQQQHHQPTHTRLPDMNDENTTAMDYLSAAVATTDEQERNIIITAYHAWKDKQEELLLLGNRTSSSKNNNNNNNSCPVAKNCSSNSIVKSTMAGVEIKRRTKQLSMQKRQDESNTAVESTMAADKKRQQQDLVLLDSSTPMDFLTAAMAAADDDARQVILDSYAQKMYSASGLDDDNNNDDRKRMMDEYDRGQVLAEEGRWTVMAENQQQQHYTQKDSATDPMSFLSAIMAAPDDDIMEKVLREYQSRVEQELDEQDEENDDDDDDNESPAVPHPSCENNTAMAFLTAAMAAPDDQAKEQVLADYQAWTKTTQAASSLTNKNNDNSNTAMAFLAAAMAAPDANAKEAVLADYQQWARQKEAAAIANNDHDDDESDDHGLGAVFADYETWKIARVEKYLQEHLKNKEVQAVAAVASDDGCSQQESSDTSGEHEVAPLDDFFWRREYSSYSSSSSLSRQSTSTHDLMMTDGDNDSDDSDLGIANEENNIVMQTNKKSTSDDSVDDAKSTCFLKYKFNARLQQKYDKAAVIRNKSLLQLRLDELQKPRVKSVMADFYTWKKQLCDGRPSVAIVLNNLSDDSNEQRKNISTCSYATDSFVYDDDKNAKSSVTGRTRRLSQRGLKIGALLLVMLGLIAFVVVHQVLGMHRVVGPHDGVPLVAAVLNVSNDQDSPFRSSTDSVQASEKKDIDITFGADNSGTIESSVGPRFGGKKFFLLDIPELTSELLLNYTLDNANRFYANSDPLHRAEMWLHRGFQQMTAEQGRTMDPIEADVFLVPAYLHWRWSLPVELDRQVTPMIEARLIDKSKPHVLLVPTTSPIRSSAIHLRPLSTLLSNAGVDVYSVGFERNIFWQGLESDKIIPIPHVVETPNEVSSSAAALDGNRTENFVFYAEDALADSAARSGCDRSMVAPLQNRDDMDIRLLPEDDEPLSMIDRHRHMTESEFCLVTCGTTPTTDTLAASVIAGCIPIRVGSRWQGECEIPCHVGWGWNVSPPQVGQRTHLPFSDQIDWDAFPQVNEAVFTYDPLATLQEVFRTTSAEDKRKLQAEMNRVQLSLIYGWGSPVESNQFGEVYQHIWETIVYNIGLVEGEGW